MIQINQLELKSTLQQKIADDIKGLVDGMGKIKFTLVGHNWGGVISWIFAALYPVS